MPATVLGESWLASNLTRAYPLAPFATKTDTTGTFTLPDDFLVSLYFPTGPELSIDPTPPPNRSVPHRPLAQAGAVFRTKATWDMKRDCVAEWASESGEVRPISDP